MKHKELRDIIFKKAVWTIKNHSTLSSDLHSSEVFTVGGRAWKFLLYYTGGQVRFYLKVADVQSLPQGWSVYAAFTFTVVNQASPENSKKIDLNKKFSINDGPWVHLYSMEFDKLQNDGYILNDKCIVEVESSEVNSEGTQVVGQIIEKALVTEEEDDVVDFKDLGKIEKSLVPLLEEVCSWHSSLLDCKENKSCRFTEWVFTALAQVLQFLKNKKWKDMNEKACEELQQLWKELEMSRLDLSWLEPLVKSAINMKGYDEKLEKVKKMKQNLVMLETEMNMIKEKLVITEQSIEMLRKELVNAAEDFEEKDLEAEIGYGKPQ